MKAGKSPGLDGSPAEYYKKYIDLVAPGLTEVCTKALAEGQLSLTFNEAVITVLVNMSPVALGQSVW